MSAVRSLGKAGYKIVCIGDSVFTTGFWSRYCSKRVICKAANAKNTNFGEAFLKLLNSFGDVRPVIFPMEDATLIWCSENEAMLKKKADFLLPEHDNLLCAENKAKTMELAQSIGIPCPETFFPDNVDDFVYKIKHNKHKDFVVKPVFSSGSLGLVYGDTKTEPEWREHWNHYGPSIIQERLDSKGEGIGVSVVMDENSNCIASFVHKRLKQYPLSGGPASSRVSIEYPALVQQSIRLLKALSWSGVAMVEWKMDLKTSTPKLMEINPRFWGSLELAVRAGVDFPVLYAELSKGISVKPVTDYTVGIVCKWMIPGEILRYLSEPKVNRERFIEFIKGLPGEAEEWDKTDIRGSLACVICPALLVLSPKYWKYLKRK